MKTRWLAPGLVLAAAVAIVGLMAHSYLVADPPQPRVGTAAYGHNPAGALAWCGSAVLAEAALVALLLTPWRASPSPALPGLGLALFVPGALIAMVMAMHAGPVIALHWLFTVLCVLVLLAVAIVRLIRLVSGRALPTA